MPVLASAPGKVLLTGGYLVLDPEYRGLVFATGSRFYAYTQSSPASRLEVVVSSPQFVDGHWSFIIDTDTWTISEKSSKNPFVECALTATCQFANTYKKVQPEAIDITIRGANDFYSHDGMTSLPPFAPLSCPISKVHKTGLGSSAALVSSICASLFQHLTGLSLPEARDPIHSVAQYAHCLAQGKIGSGFDVSAAVYGSQLFRRFDPACLSSLMGQESPSSADLAAVLNSPDLHAGSRIVPLDLPRGLVLFLAEVDQGSHTPSLVSKVLQWKKTSADSTTLYDSLDTTNEHIAKALSDFSHASVDIPTLSSTPQSQWAPGPWSTLAHKLKAMTNLLRKLGQNADVPIVPDTHISLFEKLETVPGILGAGVPGAGGYDALWILSIDHADAQERVQETLREFPHLHITLLSSDATVVGGHSSEGVVNHSPAEVVGFG